MITPVLFRRVIAPILAFACWVGASASAAQFGDFTYTDDGTSITITDYPNDAVGAVEIPQEIVGKPVTMIGTEAFESCDGLTSVTIGNGVTSIGDNTFYKCYGLTSVAIPDSVTSAEFIK